MFRKMLIFGLLFVFALSLGCASVNSELDRANIGAKEAGKPVGRILQLPMSGTEGVAEGIAGERDKNPYGR